MSDRSYALKAENSLRDEMAKAEAYERERRTPSAAGDCRLGAQTSGQLHGACEATDTSGPAYSRARSLLENRQTNLRREANAIQSLLDALPAKLPSDAELALANLVISGR